MSPDVVSLNAPTIEQALYWIHVELLALIMLVTVSIFWRRK